MYIYIYTKRALLTSSTDARVRRLSSAHFTGGSDVVPHTIKTNIPITRAVRSHVGDRSEDDDDDPFPVDISRRSFFQSNGECSSPKRRRPRCRKTENGDESRTLRDNDGAPPGLVAFYHISAGANLKLCFQAK